MIEIIDVIVPNRRYPSITSVDNLSYLAEIQ